MSTSSLSLSLSLSASPEVSEGDDGISFCALVGLRFEQHEMEMEWNGGHPTPHPIQHIHTRTGTEWNTVRTGIGGKLLKRDKCNKVNTQCAPYMQFYQFTT